MESSVLFVEEGFYYVVQVHLTLNWSGQFGLGCIEEFKFRIEILNSNSNLEESFCPCLMEVIGTHSHCWLSVGAGKLNSGP